MEKLNPYMFAERESEEIGARENVQWGVTTRMMADYLQAAHSMPWPVALAVADHIWDAWNDIVEDDTRDIRQGDLINDVIKGWVR